MNFLIIILPIITFFALNHYCKTKQAPKANRFIISGFCSVATFIIMVSTFGPGNEVKPESVIIAAKPSPAAAQTKPVKQILPVAEWQKLYQELEKFKTDSVFLKYGFGGNGQLLQRQWFKKVNSHILPLDVNPAWQATPSNLRQLAMAYIRKDSATVSRLKKELNKVFEYGNT